MRAVWVDSSVIDAKAHAFAISSSQIANVDERYASSPSKDEEILLYLLLLRRKRRRIKAANRKTWVKSWVSCQAQGA